MVVQKKPHLVHPLTKGQTLRITVNGFLKNRSGFGEPAQRRISSSQVREIDGIFAAQDARLFQLGRRFFVFPEQRVSSSQPVTGSALTRVSLTPHASDFE